MAANSFGVAIRTVSSVIYLDCHSISTYFGPKYLHLPRNEIRQNSSPSESFQEYFCYKQFHSLNVQTVCDLRGLFMDIECRWPGSVHDRKVFANSSISMKVRNGALSQTFQTLIPRLEKSQIILLETLHTLWHHTIWKNMTIVVIMSK